MILLLTFTFFTASFQNVAGFNNTSHPTNDSQCPLWMERDTSGQCQCGDDLDRAVQCDSKTKQVSILQCYCITYNEDLNKTLVGRCMFTCVIHTTVKLFLIETTEREELNNISCNNYNRDGQMCGKCKQGYSPPVYSYNFNCVECSNYKYNWLKYIAVAFLPITLTYLAVVFFRISLTSGSMVSYIMLCQIMSSTSLVRILFRSFIEKDYTDSQIAVMKLILSSYSIWNLDALRSVFDPFCLHPRVTTLQVLTLDYVVGMYPLLLIFITYVLVKLHDRFSAIVRLCKPFYKCFACYRRKSNNQISLTKAFATFFLMSYVKILNVSFDLLTPAVLYDMDDNPLNNYYLYYDGTVKYFGREHLPYAILALFITIIFSILPLLILCLYPCACFHKCLNGCNTQYMQSLYIFMDAFQGCYSHKPRDFRYFAALYFVLKILNLLILGIVLGPLYTPVLAVVLSVTTIIIALLKPYKISRHNTIDIILLFWFGLIQLFIISKGYVVALDAETDRIEHLLDSMIVFLISSFPLYGLGVAVHRITPKCCKSLKTYIAMVYQSRKNAETFTDEELPHRIEHSHMYSPIIHVNSTYGAVHSS